MKTPEPIGQQGRWSDLFSEYYITIHHQHGRVPGNSDALSRRPCERGTETDCQQCLRPTLTRTAEPISGSFGASRRSDAMSGDWLVVDRSEDLSACEWSGRKRSGLGSAVGLSTGSASLEIGSAVHVGVAHGHCWQSVSVPLSQGRHDSAWLFPRTLPGR